MTYSRVTNENIREQKCGHLALLCYQESITFLFCESKGLTSQLMVLFLLSALTIQALLALQGSIYLKVSYSTNSQPFLASKLRDVLGI